MGAKPTKMMEKTEIKMGGLVQDNLDPRSPLDCRTPIILTKTHNNQQQQQQQDSSLGVLSKRLFKGFNLKDPRSPSQFNRTPLFLDDTIEKTFNMDDTFADLFVEAPTANFLKQVQVTVNKEVHMEIEMMDDEGDLRDIEVEVGKENREQLNKSLQYEEEETVASPSILKETPQISEFVDPRSPTVSIERTPIIFDDDDDNDETNNAHIEEILATLSLDLSDANSSGTPTSHRIANKPTNKHLERVRLGRRMAHGKRRGKSQQIHLDIENMVPIHSSSPAASPKIKNYKLPTRSLLSSSATKRTPLSCVKNQNNQTAKQTIRSRSVEHSIDDLKKRLSFLGSYEDLSTLKNSTEINLEL